MKNSFLSKLKFRTSKINSSAKTYLQKYYLPGRTRISLFQFFYYLWQGFRNESLTIRASALAYKLFLSLFPALIFIVTLLPYVSGKDFQGLFIQTLGSVMPEYSFKAVESTIRDVLYNPKFGLLSAVFLLTLFYSVSNMQSIMKTFNTSFYIIENRPFYKRILIAAVLTLMFFSFIIFALAFISFNQSLIKWLIHNHFIKSVHYVQIIQYSRWLALFLILLFGLSIFYFLAPAARLKFKLFTPGSIFAAFFFIIISIVFNLFVNHFSSYNRIYGVLSVVLVFFIWLYYISVIFLIGFEINASLYIAPVQKSGIKESDVI